MELALNHRALQHDVVALARRAGEAIMPFYRNDVGVERKADASPVTEADIAAHHVIEAGLLALAPDVPVISEEGDHSWDRSAEYFWLVDPLDGTKSFIKGRDEFTVNIALIHRDTPVFGVIDVPAQGVTYWGDVTEGAYRQRGEEAVEAIKTSGKTAGSMNVVVSFSHLDPMTEEFLAPIEVGSRIAAASSLKFCAVAEGRADIYPRFGPTMEWDTAAGHAIVAAAGGSVTQPNGDSFVYGKQVLKNGAFIVRAV